MWVLENINFKIGGPIDLKHPLRIRHFSLGLYLSISINDDLTQEI